MIRGRYMASSVPLGEVRHTVGSMLLERGERWPDHPVFGWREDGGYRTVPWERFLRDIADVAGFLTARGVGRGDRVSVFSPNTYRMLVWEMAVLSMGATSVPVFAGYGVRNVRYLLEHAEPAALYVDGEERLAVALEAGAERVVGTLVTAQPSRFVAWEAMAGAGSVEALREAVASVGLDDVCLIQYTSGTTGDPKGVMLTHRNVISQQVALDAVWEIPHSSRFLSYLPWHHSFGGLFERFSALWHGATLYLEDGYGKDIRRLIDNWRLVRPTQFFSVPKVYIALVTEARLDPEVRRTLLHPELRFVFTAAAPLPRECAEFFKEHGVPVLEGWGLTETSPCVTLTPPGKERVHSYVGEPIPGCEVLTSETNEILVRGPNVMRGYFRDPERTARVLDPLGWFRTGDLGEITDYGLRMICRVDGLFKLANGEKVSSMEVENQITLTSRWVQFALAVGLGEEFVGALVFPNVRALRAWGETNGRTWPDLEALARDPAVHRLIGDEIAANMRQIEKKYQRVKAFAVVPRELSIDAGELTPTMKVVRRRVLDRYRDLVEAIYRPGRHPEAEPYVVRLEETRSAVAGPVC